MLLLVGGLSMARDGGRVRERASAKRTTTSTTTPQPVAFAVNNTDINGTAPPSEAVVGAVLAQLGVWANQGIVDPLRAGVEAPPLAELFSAAARPTATGAERANLFVLGLPKSDVEVVAASTALWTVAGPDAGTAVVVAGIHLKLRATGPDHAVDIVRNGEIAFVPEADGVWRIEGWSLRAEEVSA